jgi:hypothetical protein
MVCWLYSIAVEVIFLSGLPYFWGVSMLERLLDAHLDWFTRPNSNLLLRVGGTNGNKTIEHWNYKLGKSVHLKIVRY